MLRCPWHGEACGCSASGYTHDPLRWTLREDAYLMPQRCEDLIPIHMVGAHMSPRRVGTKKAAEFKALAKSD